MDLDDYTVCIGANGAGKSTILYAIGWFFDKLSISGLDAHFDQQDSQIEVTITIDNLTDDAKNLLGRFGRKGSACFTRHYDSDQNRTWYTGHAWMGPGFNVVLNSSGVAAIRSAYKDLRESQSELEELSGNFTLGQITDVFHVWENAAENQAKLELIEDCQADDLFKADGPFHQTASFVLMRGSADLSHQIGSSAKDAAITELTGSLVSSALSGARLEWESRHEDDLNELSSATTTAIAAATQNHESRINNVLKQFVPDVEIVLHAAPTTITVRNDSSISTKVRVGSRTEQDVTTEGHGTQRAVMMAMVQSLAEVPTTEDTMGPLLVIAAEEPEIYQHPVRARFFAKSLADLSTRPRSQVLVATHSPYFIRPDQFRSLRRLSMVGGESKVHGSSAKDVAYKLGKSVPYLMNHLVQQLPKSFSEGFFSECVVLMEGDTDSVIIDGVAELLGVSFEGAGITLWPIGSKDVLPVNYHILISLGTKVYTVVDGDYDANETCEEKISSRRKSTNRCLNVVWPVNALGESLEYAFGSETVVGFNMTVFEHDLEKVLKSWGSFQEAKSHTSKEKDSYVYRTAVARSRRDDIPEAFVDLVKQIVTFARS